MWTPRRRRRTEPSELVRLVLVWIAGMVALGAVAAAGQRVRTGPAGTAPPKE
jgi:hypothetical protein